jgi:hypothetical protein
MKMSNTQFKPGNEYWKLRSKHGRDTLFQSPELLWDAACEYFQSCEDNPLFETVFVGKEGRKELVPKVNICTKEGLYIYLRANEHYFEGFKETEAYKSSPDFQDVISRIEQIIYNQQFVNAAAGLINPNIVARKLGLAEKNENINKTITVEV